MESKKTRGSMRLWQLGICFLLFLGAIFFRSLSGRMWNPSGGAQTLKELAGKVGEALAQSPVVEAFAEGFRSGKNENVVEAAGTTQVHTASSVKSLESTVTEASQTRTADTAAKVTDKPTEKDTETAKQTTQTERTTETSLPLLTKRAGGSR